MRVTTAFSRLLCLPGVWVRKVRFEPDRVIVEVALKRRRLICPECGYSVAARKEDCRESLGLRLWDDLLADISYDDDPRAYNEAVLRKLEVHYPMCFERVDPDSFGLQGPTDLLQGALTPVVREDYIRLGSGTFALAMGDAHCVVDPVNGQGANSASYSAWVIGHTILEDMALDEQFCRRVARDRQAFVYGVSDWTNMILNPEPHVVGLLMAMAQSKSLCDAYTQNFNHPDRQWEAVATPERTAAFIARHAAGQPAVAV